MAQTTVNVLKDHDAQVKQFGANGKSPQAAVVLPTNAVDLATSEALVNAIKALLIANGLAA